MEHYQDNFQQINYLVSCQQHTSYISELLQLYTPSIQLHSSDPHLLRNPIFHTKFYGKTVFFIPRPIYLESTATYIPLPMLFPVFPKNYPFTWFSLALSINFPHLLPVLPLFHLIFIKIYKLSKSLPRVRLLSPLSVCVCACRSCFCSWWYW